MTEDQLEVVKKIYADYYETNQTRKFCLYHTLRARSMKPHLNDAFAYVVIFPQYDFGAELGYSKSQKKCAALYRWVLTELISPLTLAPGSWLIWTTAIRDPNKLLPILRHKRHFLPAVGPEL